MASATALGVTFFVALRGRRAGGSLSVRLGAHAACRHALRLRGATSPLSARVFGPGGGGGGGGTFLSRSGRSGAGPTLRRRAVTCAATVLEAIIASSRLRCRAACRRALRRSAMAAASRCSVLHTAPASSGLRRAASAAVLADTAGANASWAGRMNLVARAATASGSRAAGSPFHDGRSPRACFSSSRWASISGNKSSRRRNVSLQEAHT